MSDALQQRLADTEAEITAEKAKRAEAAASGKAFSSTRLHDLEAKAAGLRDAIDVEQRRSRDDRETARLARVSAEKQAVEKSFAALLEAEQQAEAACRQLADSVGRALKIANGMCASISRLNGRGSPIPLQSHSLVTRLSGRISAVMSTVPNHQWRLGELQWRCGMYTPLQDWMEDEKAILSRHVAPENLQPLEKIAEKEIENVD